jgi:rare lipoprotein A
MGSASRVVCVVFSVGLMLPTLLPGSAAARQTRAEFTKASWYGRGFHGRRTASGSRFDAGRLTAAHRTLRLGSNVRVTELNSGRSVVVQITDRGPYVNDRGIDLSYAAARELGIVDRGVAKVKIEMVRAEPRGVPIGTSDLATDALAWWPPAILR